MWRIEYEPSVRILSMRLAREVRVLDMRALSRAHAKALEATGGEPFAVLADLRGLRPLGADSAAVFQDMKRVAAQLEGYRARAILVDGATIGMQQRNARLEEGSDPTELITLDAEEAQRFIRDALI
jgi:hypothetical protein